jgi:drug/metabolite transporter (DMT)-like permease
MADMKTDHEARTMRHAPGLWRGIGTVSAVAYRIAPPFLAPFAWVIFRRRPSLLEVAGVALALCGAIVLAAGPALSVVSALSILLAAAVAAQIMRARRALLIRRAAAP